MFPDGMDSIWKARGERPPRAMWSKFWDWFTRAEPEVVFSPEIFAANSPRNVWHGVDFEKNSVKSDSSEETILDEAKRLVYGDREQDYGHPKVDFGRTATLWRAYFQARGQGAVNVDASDVARMMMLLKISRLLHCYHRDSAVDIAGYAATLDRVES